MSRLGPSERDATAAQVALRFLDRSPPAPPVLLAGEGVEPVEEALRSGGLEVRRWRRRLLPDGDPARVSPWPGGPAVQTALYRIPKAKDEIEMSVHGLLSVLVPGGRLVLYGMKDEGITSVDRRLTEVPGLGGGFTTALIKARARVLSATFEGAETEGLRSTLADWRTETEIRLGGEDRPWVTYPGLFAGGGVDPGTALLLEALPHTDPLDPGSSILDFACGTGVVGAALQARNPGARLHLVDNDAVAVAAAKENVPGATVELAATLPEGPYHRIVSNPPYHQGKAEDLGVLADLVARAPGRLLPGGRLILVVQRRLPVEQLLEGAFGPGRATVLREDGTYRVWSAVRGA